METPEAAVAPTHAAFVIEHSLPTASRASFLALQASLHEAARQVPGYVSSLLEQVPTGRDDALHYRSTVSFESANALLAWLDSEVRRRLIAEARAKFDYDYALHSSVQGFEGWFPHHDDGPPPSWKTSLLVLVTLYPTVLELGPLLRPLTEKVAPGTAMLVGNVVSVAITGWILLPIANRWYRPWLRPGCDGRTQAVGTVSALLILLAVWLLS